MASKKKGKRAPERFHFFPQEGASHEGRIGTMTLAEDMRDLAQEIVNSFDARIVRVKALKHETAEMLKGFQHDLRQKATDLKRFLRNAEASRMTEFRAMHERIRAHQDQRNGNVADMLGAFRREREAAAAHWRGMATTMAKRRAGATQ